MDRRNFCRSAVVAAFSFHAPTLRSLAKNESTSAPLVTGNDVMHLDRDRILQAADSYLAQRPITVTAYTSLRSKGGLHDYFSEGDYWWPNPHDPSGPYIRRDGYSNPANFNAHREALIRLSIQMPALVAAYVITRDLRYAHHAMLHLRAWFLDPATRMNPSLRYAQAISGITTGRGIGIIDTIHLIEVTRAARHLEKAAILSGAERSGLKSWFAQYLGWMRISKNGREEEAARNNHGSCWVAQVAAFAAFTNDHEVLALCREQFKTELLPTQLAPDGSFPLELARTKPYNYSLFNLDILSVICRIVNEGSATSEDLWRFTTQRGQQFKKAIEFMYPYIKDKKSWPYRHDVEYFDDLPNRQPSLLFAGLAYREPKYIALWRTLPPDPKTPEILRNFPIRQPLLWVMPV